MSQLFQMPAPATGDDPQFPEEREGKLLVMPPLHTRPWPSPNTPDNSHVISGLISTVNWVWSFSSSKPRTPDGAA